MQERALAAPAREVPSPSLSARPWEGSGSPGFDRRLQQNVSALVAAVDAAGVPVTFSKSVGEPIVEYAPDKDRFGRSGAGRYYCCRLGCSGGEARSSRQLCCAGRAGGLWRLFGWPGVSVADHASDGLPVLATDRLSSDELRKVFSAVALALPAALRDQPYPQELAKVREVVYTHAGDDAGRLYEREAEHFAGRLEARVSESAAYPPKEEWTPPAALVSQAAVVDLVCARMAAAGAEAVQLMAGDVVSDASRAVATRDAACERLQDVVVPALRDAGVPVRIDPQSTVSHYVPDPRPARAQTGPAQDAVVISGMPSVRTFRPGRWSRSRPRRWPRSGSRWASEAALTVPRPARLRPSSPAARAVPAPARAREGAACAHFANRQLADLWPARVALPALPRAAVSVKVAAGEARAWVAGAVAPVPAPAPPARGGAVAR